VSFTEVFGREPDGRWSAPGRVNLIGEHVDYAGGLCLPFALDRRTVVEVAARPDDRLRLRSLAVPDQAWEGRIGDVGPGVPGGWPGYAAGVPWALRAAGHAVPGLDVLVTETVPLGAGLSSSAALGCAVAVAVDDLAGLGLAGSDQGRRVLAAAAQRAENEVVGAPTGGIDQVAALFSTPGRAVLLDCRDDTVRLLALPLPGLVLLVVDTRVRHTLADGQYARRRADVERAAALLGVPTLREAGTADLDRLPAELLPRARHVLTETARVAAAVALLERDRDPRELGPLLDASHASLAGDFAVSCAELDLAVTAARAAGAHGARMIGGGFGGSAIALVDADRAGAVTAAVEAAFAAAGLAPPRVFPAVPSAGAGRHPAPRAALPVGHRDRGRRGPPARTSALTEQRRTRAGSCTAPRTCEASGVYFTDRGIEELVARRGEERVSVDWLADRLRVFVDLHPEFEDAVERLATFLARDDTDDPD
jgi:galactokinase